MIDPTLAAFLQEGLGIHLGTRNGQFEPNGARAAAVGVDEDAVHVVVYLAEVAATRLLPDLQAGRQAAVVFARPTDDRACQVKGEFVSARPAREDERAFVRAQWDGFLANLERIGIPRAVADGWITWPAVAVRLRATAVFDQTPGPSAGGPIANPS